MRGSVVVWLVAALLVVVAVCSGGAYLFHFDDAEHSKTSVSLQLQRPDLDIPEPALRFLVTANSLDPVERKLKATLSIVPTSSDDGPEFVDRNSQPVIDPATGKLRPEFADLNLTVRITNLWVEDVEVSYPLAKVVEPVRTPETLASGSPSPLLSTRQTSPTIRILSTSACSFPCP